MWRMPDRQRTRERLIEGDSRPWLALLVAARLVATALAVGLTLLAPEDPFLAALAAYGLLSAVVIAVAPTVRRSPVAWLFDSSFVLACVLVSGDWRRPFYPLWLTTLALPAVQLPFRRAIWLAVAAPFLYVAVAFFGGPQPGHVHRFTSETLAIHLLLPTVLVGGLAYAVDVLRRLQAERLSRERLAIEAERRRIAWELHDSAKQRLHAAHLLVSSLEGRVPPNFDALVQRSVVELQSAGADMDTSLAELRSPLEGRPLDVALGDRAAELQTEDGPRITVRGRAPQLPPLVAAHAYRIGCEALTNALRHAGADQIEVTLDGENGRFRMCVIDDGDGIADGSPAAGMGMLAMRGRAESIGASLTIAPRPGTRGTCVEVQLSNPQSQGGPA